jgi:hypothetical protein
MSQKTTQHELLAGNSDRRRMPRYSCSGQAQITCLPLNGALLGGKLRDLGLGGCGIECIETTSPFDLGARTEILVEVNSWSFRAMAHVRAVRGQSGISVEFMRMSAGGYSMLTDLIAELERPPTVVARQGRPLEHASRFVRSKSGLGPALSDCIAIVGTIVPSQPVEETSPDANCHAWVPRLHSVATSVDIFV